ncbi:MAG: PqqD family protein [Saprospiraceae bacterium]|nr:PqqD family protein [Saprospiraceae bacterium]
MNPAFQINPALTIEDFGNEIIIVNLHNGAYFTLKNTAAKLWRSAAAAASLPEVLAALSKEFTLDKTAVGEIGRLLRQFREDELAHFEDKVLDELAAFPAASPNGKPSFPATDYEKFTNMQDILLLDPIHDVGELGWPHRKA